MSRRTGSGRPADRTSTSSDRDDETEAGVVSAPVPPSSPTSRSGGHPYRTVRAVVCRERGNAGRGGRARVDPSERRGLVIATAQGTHSGRAAQQPATDSSRFLAGRESLIGGPTSTWAPLEFLKGGHIPSPDRQSGRFFTGAEICARRSPRQHFDATDWRENSCSAGDVAASPHSKAAPTGGISAARRRSPQHFGRLCASEGRRQASATVHGGERPCR